MMVVTSKVLMVFYMLFCKVHQVLLFNRCSYTGPCFHQYIYFKDIYGIIFFNTGVIICYGHVWTEPASLIQMGQNISINCHVDKELCENGKLYLVLNKVRVKDQLLTVINETTIQLQLQDYQHPFSTVQCNVNCPQKHERMICGTQFCLGCE
ncbi:hypothetical protein JD844_017813 [Phrynosoma platyrhinos]|uniref:Uncharacterized protein n=1 Tax=Phrynosoma platyrhinos TaxID=52577 RepID=A0ABQ7SMI9_PHRPL|nr:hypothetical protein JD844_017813 [Phrynosoma platyrhinos]